MKITVSKSHEQVYLLPYIKVTHKRILNGDLELIIGWLHLELVIGI